MDYWTVLFLHFHTRLHKPPKCETNLHSSVQRTQETKQISFNSVNDLPAGWHNFLSLLLVSGGYQFCLHLLHNDVSANHQAIQIQTLGQINHPSQNSSKNQSLWCALAVICRPTLLEERELRLYTQHVHPSRVRIIGCNVWLHLWSSMLFLKSQW